jgi:malate/lactate dehydrogenase
MKYLPTNTSERIPPNKYFPTTPGAPIRQVVKDDAYLNDEFIETIQKRGAAIINARKASSALSAARAAVRHMRSWFLGTEAGEFVSMGVLSDGEIGRGICVDGGAVGW